MQLFSHSLTNSDSPDIVLEFRGRVPCVGWGGGGGGQGCVCHKTDSFFAVIEFAV